MTENPPELATKQKLISIPQIEIFDEEKIADANFFCAEKAYETGHPPLIQYSSGKISIIWFMKKVINI